MANIFDHVTTYITISIVGDAGFVAYLGSRRRGRMRIGLVMRMYFHEVMIHIVSGLGISLFYA